ncbi:hypothetical protein E0Z10_g1004 [Xylaria hypoxylon]|uniref:MaoC-like domain-containing protein n=1 Tax=Xylaria hypoxylon TaxID=37992 RepID=A0A4Z0Z6A8_9PEZI|nr:hypothetical protein E0Z10_g1004 [Xylaria hypoxylon]
MRGLGKPGRQLMKLCQSRAILQRALAPISAAQQYRYTSATSDTSQRGAGSVNIEAIRADMLSRPPQMHSDMMHPTNSYLLTEALSDFLPEECFTEQQIPRENVSKTSIPIEFFERYEKPTVIVPAGHHLVYFPLHLRGSQLCPDGTDPYHSPRGTPFTRRMWAGGSIQGFRGMLLDEQSVCLERIVDVKVQGSAGAEKIFVEVLREYTSFEDFNNRIDPKSQTLRPHDLPLDPSFMFSADDPFNYGPKGLTEHRTLVFMREPSDKEKKTNLEKQRIVKAPKKPDYSVTLTPTPTLLFHYSALTYNAHRIHLDRSYCREVEGYQDLLVHGPLSLSLMLSVLQSRLTQDKNQCAIIDNIDYRHLAPLYVGQPMRICVALQKPLATKSEKKYSGDEGQRSKVKGERKGEELEEEEVLEVYLGMDKWDIWVENQDGSLCVKGTAETVKGQILSDWDKLRPSQRRVWKRLIEIGMANEAGMASETAKRGHW